MVCLETVVSLSNLSLVSAAPADDDWAAALAEAQEENKKEGIDQDSENEEEAPKAVVKAPEPSKDKKKDKKKKGKEGWALPVSHHHLAMFPN